MANKARAGKRKKEKGREGKKRRREEKEKRGEGRRKRKGREEKEGGEKREGKERRRGEGGERKREERRRGGKRKRILLALAPARGGGCLRSSAAERQRTKCGMGVLRLRLGPMERLCGALP